MPPNKKAARAKAMEGAKAEEPQVRISLSVPKVENSIPKLVELKASLIAPNEASGDHTLRAVLRAAPTEIELLGHLIDIAIRELTVHVSVDGGVVSDTERFGEPKKDNELKIKKTETSSSLRKGSASGEASAGFNLLGPKGAIVGRLSGIFERKTEVRTSIKDKETHLFVRAMGDNSWQVRELEGELDSTYLADEPLCLIQRNKGGNRLAVNVYGIIKEKDLIADLSPLSSNKLNVNKEKLIKALIAKCVNTHKGHYRGYICVSETEIADEG